MDRKEDVTETVWKVETDGKKGEEEAEEAEDQTTGWRQLIGCSHP